MNTVSEVQLLHHGRACASQVLNLVSGVFAATFLMAMALASSSLFALTLSAESRLTANGGLVSAPRLASSNGKLHLVWQGNTPGDPNGEIYYRPSTDNGVTWQAVVNLSNAPGRIDLRPSISASGNNVFVAWNGNPDQADVFYVRSTDNGTTWSTPAVLSPADNQYSRSPSVTFDGLQRLHITWYDGLPGATGAGIGKVVHRMSCDAGATWTPIQEVTANDGVVDNEHPRIAATAAGNVLIAFRSSRDGQVQGGWPPYSTYVYRSVSASCTAGVVWRLPAQRLSSTWPDALAASYKPNVAVGASGRAYLAWWDMQNGTNVRFRRGLDSNARIGPPIDVSKFGLDTPQHAGELVETAEPSIAEDDFNRVHVVFSRNESLRAGQQVGRILLAESPDSGATFAASLQQVSASALGYGPNALYASGRVHFVWADYRDSNTSSELYYRFANTNGSVFGPPQITLSPTSHTFPQTERGALSAARQVSVGNTGGSALTLPTIAPSQHFLQSNNCPASLPAASSCTINVFFAPAATGTINGTLQIFNNSSTNPVTVTLSGTAVTPVDTDADGMPDAVETVEGRNSRVKDNAIFAGLHANSDRWFAMQQYRDFLNREGDAGGISYWTGLLANNSSPRAETIQSFFGSTEFQASVAPVVRLYLAYFNRIPDYGGLSFWVNEFQSGRYTLAAISQNFATSSEFTTTYGALSNSAFVNRLYTDVLGRPADSAGAAYWTNQLDTAARNRGEVMLAFSESSEYISLRANNVYVTMMFVGMLRRSPDSGGYSYWVNFMAGGGSGLTLIQGFLGSAEYRARFLP